jgi:3-oxoacyl-[acyl-carrier-protein] synthase III
MVQTSVARSRIWGIGTSLPPRVVTNDDLSKMMETTDEWIVERTGIRERRWVAEGVGASDLGVEAAKRALDNAGVKKEEIDLIIFATLSPDQEFPGCAPLVQHKLGLASIACLDIRQQCTGFVYGLSVADAFIKAGAYKRVLLIGGEVHSVGLDQTTRGRDVTVLFGDGAGAVVVGPSDDPERGIISYHLHADGAGAMDLCVERPGCTRTPRLSQQDFDEGRHFPRMNGKKVFRNAVTRMPEVVFEALLSNGLTMNDVKLVLPHQANLRINEMVQKLLGLPDEKIFNNIQKYGNTTAATIPLLMDEALQLGKFKEKDLLCLVAFGAGYTWASLLLRW